MTDPLNIDLNDEELLVEITLLTALMIAANDVDGPMSIETIDRVLRGGPPALPEPLPIPSARHQRPGRPGPIDNPRVDPPEGLAV
jgi:hypothetical protein